MRIFFLSLLGMMMAFTLHAGPPSFKTVETNQPFDRYLSALKSSISEHKMGIVAEACATCGAKAIGVEISGNRVIMIFNPHFAVHMLKASIPAGIEAPLRLYVTEAENGTARLSYRSARDVFAPYNIPALDEMAVELDIILEKIIKKSL